jgi:tetratricopeptide (TPR) repeat protein
VKERRIAAIALASLLVLLVGSAAAAIVLASRGEGGDRPPPEAAAGQTPAPRSTADRAADGFVRGSILGLRCSTASRFLRERYALDNRPGCVILRVDGRSGAEHAGLRVGNKIVAIENMPITSGRQFTWQLGRFAGVRHLTFTIERAGTRDAVSVEFGRYADPPTDDPYSHYLVARGNRDDATAIENYGKQLESDPGFDLALAYRAELVVKRAGTDPAQLAAAEADLQTALEIDPDLAEAHEIYARLLSWKLSRFDDALAHIQRAIELAGCAPPISSSDLDCGEITLTRAEVYLGRNEPGDIALIRQDVGTVGAVVAVARRAAGIASQADSKEVTVQRGAGRCKNDLHVIIPCALSLQGTGWTMDSITASEQSTRMILKNLAGEPMSETHFSLAQMIANRGGDLSEVIEQLNLAVHDASCGPAAVPGQCAAKYVFARGQTYFVRDMPGDRERAAADFRAVIGHEPYSDEAKQDLAFVD